MVMPFFYPATFMPNNSVEQVCSLLDLKVDDGQTSYKRWPDVNSWKRTQSNIRLNKE